MVEAAGVEPASAATQVVVLHACSQLQIFNQEETHP